MWAFPLGGQLWFTQTVTVATLATPCNEISCEEGACFQEICCHWILQSWFTLLGSVIFPSSLSQPLAVPSISAQCLPLASPVGIAVITEPNTAVCTFWLPNLLGGTAHPTPSHSFLLRAEGLLCSPNDCVLRIKKVNLSCHPPLSSVALRYYRKDAILFALNSCFLLCRPCCTVHWS